MGTDARYRESNAALFSFVISNRSTLRFVPRGCISDEAWFWSWPSSFVFTPVLFRFSPKQFPANLKLSQSVNARTIKVSAGRRDRDSLMKSIRRCLRVADKRGYSGKLALAWPIALKRWFKAPKMGREEINNLLKCTFRCSMLAWIPSVDDTPVRI